MAASLKSDFASDYPAQSRWSIEVVPLQQSLVGDVRPMLLVLLGAVMLIVLIASVNIANLLLARAAGRQREVAIRLAIGATRGRIIRQMLTEAVILSLLGGAAGILTVAAVLGFVLRFVPSRIPRLHEVSVDWVVVGFALVVSVITGIVFGLVPAIQSVKTDIFASVREGSKGSGYNRKTGRMRDVLIVAELALAVVLMVGAGLLLRTFWTLVQQDPGFSPSRVVTANVWIPVPNDPKADKYAAPGAVSNFVRETMRRVNAIPGIEMAAVTSSLPATNPGFPVSLYLEDHPAESTNDLAAGLIIISPDYFRLMQATMIRGRAFSEDDQQDKPKVAIIDESTMRHYWPNQDAIGKRLKVGTNPKAQWITVVGIIRDIKHDGLDKDGVPHIYLSIDQNPVRSISLVARTALPATTLEQQFRHEIQAVDSGLPVYGVRSMNDVIDVSLAPRRFSAELVGAFAGLALLLATVGIYGLLAYMVGQRTNEIGLRMALGASPTNILRLIIGKGAVLATIGVLTGLLCAVATAPLLASLLYGVRVIDPQVFLAVPAILTAVALVASYIPARRATRINPTTALRQE
jgi:putative ABC transport system permease protein